MKETNKLDKKLELLTLLDKVIIEKNNVIEKNDGGVYVIRCKHYDETNYKPLFVLILYPIISSSKISPFTKSTVKSP